MTPRKRTSASNSQTKSPSRIQSQSRRPRRGNNDIRVNHTTLFLKETSRLSSLYSAEPKLSKPPKAPAFKVFCDVLEPDSTMNHVPKSDCRPVLGLVKSLSGIQTVVNEKENRTWSFEHQATSAIKKASVDFQSPRQILGDKASQPAGLNCTQYWDGKIPSLPCSHESTKAKARNQPSDLSKDTSRRLQSPTTLGSSLSSNLFAPEEPRGQSISSRRAEKMEVDSLMARLEALGTSEQNDLHEGFETAGSLYDLKEPLPVDAVCPGAPKIPCSFSMPLFDSGDDGDYYGCESREITANPSKSPSNLQMSPLAEVTEAYTGLQGGWSPPLETLSPVASEPSTIHFTGLPTIIQESLDANSGSMRIQLSGLSGSEFKLDNAARLKRRREQAPVIGSPVTASARKSLMRI